MGNAWQTPHTFVVAENPTAANLNKITDDLVALAAGARVYHNANQSISDSATTALAFNTERYDTDAIHDTVTNNSRLTCKTAGKYLIGGSVQWASDSTGTREVGIRLNGATFIAIDEKTPSGVTYHTIGATIYALAVSDYVELTVFQSSGGALNVTAAGNNSPEFFMHFLGG